jgi:AraC-like DNA-binding protein
MLPIRQLTFRPAPAPGISSPLTVRSTGRYRFHAHEEANVPRGFSQLFWVAEGELRYGRDGRWWRATAGDVFHYGATEPHRVRADEAYAGYYWITFDGSFVGQWLDARMPARGPRRAGPCPVYLFEEIREAIGHPAPAAEKHAAELGLRLLIRSLESPAAGGGVGPTREEGLCRALEALVEAGHADPDFGIEHAADQLGCHRSTLFRIYRRQRGITPSAYLQRLRVQRALAQLRGSDRSITEIAHGCGFRDPNYFAKVIRRATGDAPRRIRG